MLKALRLLVFVSLLFLVSTPTRGRAQTTFEDDFDDGMIALPWSVAQAASMNVAEHDGALEASGTATEQYWLTGGTAILGAIHAPLAVESRFAVSGSGGYAATMSMFRQWDVNDVRLGVNSGQFWLRTAVDGAITDQYLGPADTNYHDYRIESDGNYFTAYIDGVPEGTGAIALDVTTVALHANAGAIGDAVDARFDRFSLLSAPAPFTPTFSFTFDDAAPDNPEVLPASDDCRVGAPCKYWSRVAIPDGQPNAEVGGGPPSALVNFASGGVVPDGAIVGRVFGTLRAGPRGQCATSGAIIPWAADLIESTIDAATTTGSPSDLCSFSNWPSQLNEARDNLLAANPGAVLDRRLMGCAQAPINTLILSRPDGASVGLTVVGDPSLLPSAEDWEICTPSATNFVSLGVSADNPATPSDEGGILLQTCNAPGTYTISDSFDRVDTPPGDPVIVTDTASCSPNTPPGSGVSVPLNGGTDLLGGIDLTFSEVGSGGSTAVVTTTTGPAPPAGFKLMGLADLPLYFDINTDVSYSGDLTLCMRYDESQVTGSESNLELLHYVDGGFVDITTSVDTDNDIICGTAAHLSTFVVAEPLSAPTPTVTATAPAPSTPTATRTPTPAGTPHPPSVGGAILLPPPAIANALSTLHGDSGPSLLAIGLGAITATLFAACYVGRRRSL